MNLSISNVIINYFLLHEETKRLNLSELNKISSELEKTFDVKINSSKEEIRLVVDLCEDFLQIDEDGNILQDGITDYLDSLEPVCEWFGVGDWEKAQDYYSFLKNFYF